MLAVGLGLSDDRRVKFRVKFLSACLVGLAGLTFASPAQCEETRLTVGVGTDVPLGLGGLVDLEFGPRIRLGGSAFWLPPAYVAVSDEVAQQLGGYNDLTSALVRAATEDALTLRFRAGWRPFSDSSFYIDVNYSLLVLGGAFTSEDLPSAINRTPMQGGAMGWDLESTVHQVGFEVGWRFELRERLSLRVGIGASFTVAAHVVAEARDPEFPMVAAVIEVEGADYLESTYTQYVHVPVLTVALGWDVFDSGS